MAQFETWLKTDLKMPLRVQNLSGAVFSQDSMGSLVGAAVYDGGQEAALTGTATGYIIRPDGETVVVSGQVSGHRAWIELPEAACAVPGLIQVAIRLTDGERRAVVAACVATVQRTSTDAVVDPGSVIPSLSALLAKIGALEQATAAANAAALRANAAASLAGDAAAATVPAFDPEQDYAVGDVVRLDDVLYRCVAAWDSSEHLIVPVEGSLDEEYWEPVSVGGETVVLDATLTASGQAADAKAAGDRLTALEGQVADLLYAPIAVSAFTAVPDQAEMGSTVDSVELRYTLNKAPASALLDGRDAGIANAGGSIYLLLQSLTAGKTWTLIVTDERGAAATKTASLSFLNRAYYGAAAEPAAISSAFLLGLDSGVLAATRNRSVTVNAGSGQYIWYAVPSRLGGCSFTVGGFDGGFTKVQTISHTNASGYTENYDVYRSDNASLGNTTVTVS